jgi:integrase
MFRLDGRQRSLSFQTEEHAKKFRDLVDLVGAVKALEVYKINSSPRSVSAGITVEQWLSRHIDHLTGVTKTTLWDYRSYLRNDIVPALGPIPLDNLTTEDVRRWVQVMTDKGSSGKTIANKHGFLTSALNAAVRAGHIPTNPAAGIRLPRTERPEMVFLSREEFFQLLDAVTDHWKPMVEFCSASPKTGWRC